MSNIKKIVKTGLLKTSSALKSLQLNIREKSQGIPFKFESEKVKLATGVVTMALVVGAFSFVNLTDEEQKTALKTSFLVTEKGYDVLYENQYIGTIKERDEAKMDALVKEALAKLSEANGKNYALAEELVIKASSKDLVNEKTFEEQLYTVLNENTDKLLQEMFVVELSNGKEVIMDSEKAVKSALMKVVNNYLPDNRQFDIKSVQGDVVFEKKDIASFAESSTRTLKMASAQGVVADEPTAEEKPSGLATDDETAQVQKDVPEIDSIEFADKVEVKKVFRKPSDKKTVDEAFEVLTAFEEEQIIYQVQSGDTLSGIVYGHDMTMDEIEKLNPGIMKRERTLQIGEDIIITRPNPNLSVASSETVIYEETIPRETKYEYDDTKYTSWYSTRVEGSDGVMEVKASLKKVDGVEADKDVITESVVRESVPRVIVKGTMVPPKFIPPLRAGRITSYFGPRWGSFHYALDIAESYGTNVYASAAGIVEQAGWNGGYGNLVVINHQNGYKTYYGHNSKVNVYVGQRVSQGDVIAFVGSTGNSTGNHVHFELRQYGTRINPYNYIY